MLYWMALWVAIIGVIVVSLLPIVIEAFRAHLRRSASTP